MSDLIDARNAAAELRRDAQGPADYSAAEEAAYDAAEAQAEAINAHAVKYETEVILLDSRRLEGAINDLLCDSDRITRALIELHVTGDEIEFARAGRAFVQSSAQALAEIYAEKVTARDVLAGGA